MTSRSDEELDDFQAGFLAGWFRHAGISETPTVEQLAAAVKDLAAFETEAEAQNEIHSAPEAPPRVN